MTRFNALLIALMIGFAALAGTFAVTRTTHLGAAAQKQNAAVIAQKQRQLAAGEAALRKALAASPAPAKAAAAAPAAQRVVYVRPAPIVIHKHRAGGGELEARDGGGRDD
ncbi:MAG TPA: hypothetical protein VMT59_10975 [Gaiellaceae bacterium]|nr:hypothetical protein [Gaiellaceae bacterium]